MMAWQGKSHLKKFRGPDILIQAGPFSKVLHLRFGHLGKRLIDDLGRPPSKGWIAQIVGALMH